MRARRGERSRGIPIDLILPLDILNHDRYSASFAKFIAATRMTRRRAKPVLGATRKKIEATRRGRKIEGPVRGAKYMK